MSNNIESTTNMQSSDNVMNKKNIDSNCFLIAKGIGGLDVVCKDIQDFSTTYLTKKNNELLFKINSDSFIDSNNPDYDYEGCLVLELADHNDLRVTIGYKIWGIAKKWDTSKEPHSIIDQINVNLTLGEGIPVFNNKKKNVSCIVACDDFKIANSLASLGYFTVLGNSLDEAFLIINYGLPESYFRVMIGNKTPYNKDFYININHDLEKDNLKNYVESQIKYLKDKIEKDAIHQDTANISKSTLNLVRMSDINPQRIVWLWKGWLALGKFTVLAGAGGCGKTNLAIALAAIITSGGVFPDGTHSEEKGEVIILSMEDDPDDTIQPRLIANGADTSKIFMIDDITNEKGEKIAFDPLRDMRLIEDILKVNSNIKLLIVDPIVSLVSGDMNKANDVRRSLQPLVELANKYKFSILGITHFSKGSANSSPADRVIGSQAFTALARMVWSAAKSDDESSCILVRSKSNISKLDGGIEYTLKEVSVPDPKNDEEIPATRVDWLGIIDGYAKELLEETETKNVQVSAVDKAKDFLIDLLSENGKIPSNEINQKAEIKNISWASVRRAKGILKIVCYRENNKLYWALPDSFNDVPQLL